MCCYWNGHGPAHGVLGVCSAAVFRCSSGVTLRHSCLLLSIQICRLCSSYVRRTVCYKLRRNLKTWRQRHSHSPKHGAQGDSKVHTRCHMVVSPIQVDILPQNGTNLKPLLYHLISYFNLGRSVLHTVLQHDRRRLNTFPEEVKRNSIETSHIRCSSFSTRGFDWRASSWPHPA